MSKVITKIYSGTVPYEAAASSAQHGTFLELRDESAEKNNLLVRVQSLSRLFGPPRGPWYWMITRDRDDKIYEFNVYYHRQVIASGCRIELIEERP